MGCFEVECGVKMDDAAWQDECLTAAKSVELCLEIKVVVVGFFNYWLVYVGLHVLFCMCICCIWGYYKCCCAVANLLYLVVVGAGNNCCTAEKKKGKGKCGESCVFHGAFHFVSLCHVIL